MVGRCRGAPMPARFNGAMLPHGLHVQGRRWSMVFLPREEGQGLVEYALIILFIAIVVVAIMLIFGPAVGNLFSVVIENWPPVK
jgi:pilus assembly protein Flp/PilA